MYPKNLGMISLYVRVPEITFFSAGASTSNFLGHGGTALGSFLSHLSIQNSN